MDYLYNGIILLIVFTGLIIGMMAFYFSKSTHRFIAKEKGKDHCLTRIYWMLEKNLKDGSKRWVSFPFRDLKIIPPPSDVVDFLPGGKKIATGYLMSKDEVMWVSTTMDIKDKKALETFIPFSPAQRAALVNEYEKSEAELQKKLTIAQILLQYGPFMFVCLLLMVIIIFASDIFKTYNNLQQSNIQAAQSWDIIVQNEGKLLQAMGLKINVSDVLKPAITTPLPVSVNETPPSSITDKIDKLLG